MTTVEEIGVILKEKRKAQKITQNQLAFLAYNDEKYQSLISRVEKGAYKEVKFEDILLILKGLDIDLMDLILKAK